MKLTDLGTAALPVPAADANAKDPAAAAATLFAKMLVTEVRKTLPDGGLLGDGPFSALESVLDEALAERLAEGNTLGLDRLFDPHAAPVSPGHPGGVPLTNAAEATRVTPGDLVHGGRVTSRFGHRIHPIRQQRHHHDGVDIAAPRGTPIRAAAAGTVRRAEFTAGYGNVVVIDHGHGVETRYAHCRDLGVVAGQRIAAGDTIGSIGQSGRATGPHLHFEVRRDGIAVDPDAVDWLRDLR